MNEIRWNLDADHYSLMIMSEHVVLFSHYPEAEGISFSIKEFTEGKHHDRISAIFGQDTLNEMMNFLQSA